MLLPFFFFYLTCSPGLATNASPAISFYSHRKYGGKPEIDASYQYLKYFFEDDDKKLKQIYQDYKSGKMLSGELKKYAISKANSFLERHQSERKKVKIERYLI